MLLFSAFQSIRTFVTAELRASSDDYIDLLLVGFELYSHHSSVQGLRFCPVNHIGVFLLSRSSLLLSFLNCILRLPIAML